jgi:nitrate/TMAO reductase-like tetraheme cytochrome c subunit
MNATTGRPVWYLLTLHWLSLTGAALVATAFVSWLVVLPQTTRGHADNPYLGIVVFLIVPVIFFAGLALIPIGIYLSRRQIRKGLAVEQFDRKTVLRRVGWFFGVTTLVNLLIGTQVTYRAVKHMETPQFCGAACHAMKPEFSAYQNAPHSKVECVECHVAPTGVGWIQAKTSGIRQLVEVVLNTSPRPIPAALESGRLVPSKETCQNCHWSQKFVDARLRVINRYADDESNSRTQTVLLMMIGGSRSSGIHGAHFGPGIHIRFGAADPSRQTIPWIEYRNATTGNVETFVTSGSVPDPARAIPKHEMQCVDCHNRPSHSFDLPDRAMDKALGLGDIPVTLPFIKKKSVELLKANYSTSREAADKLPRALAGFYQQNYPTVYAQRSRDIEQAAKAVLTVYERNVFPELKVSWGTYPNNLGHTDSPGCFRCHDGSHTSGGGKTITQDCNSCHELVATDETSPEILSTLGMAERISKIQKQ